MFSFKYAAYLYFKNTEQGKEIMMLTEADLNPVRSL